MYRVTSSNGRVTITKGVGSTRTLAKAKSEAHAYIRAYAQAPKSDVRWAHQAVSLLTLDEFDGDEWQSPDF